jgi:hypothetical protein
MPSLVLAGPAKPIANSAVAAAFGARANRLPAAYVELLTTWGSGALCGFVDLLDPTEADGTLQHLQQALRTHGAAARGRGNWLQLSDRELVDAVVLGIDRRGAALVARATDDLLFLAPSGVVLTIGTFDALITSFLRGNGLLHSLEPKQRDRWGVGWQYELVVPAVYATEPPPSEQLFAALVRGDESTVDALLERVLELEVIPFALFALLDRVCGPTGDPIAPELRSSFAAQLFTMAKRRVPAVGEHLPLREIRQALAAGSAVSNELRDKLHHASGIEPVSILEVLQAAAPRGDQAPLPHAADRGLVAPAGFPAIDSAARIRAAAELWRTEDPTAPLDPLLERIERLHPDARHGYEVLLARLGSAGDQLAWNNPQVLEGLATPETYLAREVADAWPQLVLALRSKEFHVQRAALDILRDQRVEAVAPYILSMIEHPTWNDGSALLGDVYAALAPGGDAHLVATFAPYLATEGRTQQVARLCAFRVLERFGDDERVFEGYLRHFVAALPHSEKALAKRWDDPRVIPALREHLAREERFAVLSSDERYPNYSESFKVVAQHLARLGDAAGRAALDAYRREERRIARKPL